MTASVVDDAAEVVTAVFDQVERRDPDHARTWVALVDGNNHQIDLIEREARPARSRWRSWSTSSTFSNTWGVRPGRSSTKRTRRRNLGGRQGHPRSLKAYLDYPSALAAGWPIATGVIEGACRHLVKDRMDFTGARWGLDGAETILKSEHYAPTTTSTTPGATTSPAHTSASTSPATPTAPSPRPT